MKHAGNETLDRLEPLLKKLRTLSGAREKKRGIFYRKSKPYLHFHEDPKAIFADYRPAQRWIRLEVTTAPQRSRLLRLLRGDAHRSG